MTKNNVGGFPDNHGFFKLTQPQRLPRPSSHLFLLRRSAFRRDKQLRRVYALMGEQLELFADVPGVAHQTAAGPHPPVAGDDGDVVMSHRTAWADMCSLPNLTATRWETSP